MNKVISVLAILSILASVYVIKEVNSIMTHKHLVPIDVIDVEYTPVRTNILPEPVIPEPVIPEDALLCLQSNIYFESRNQSVVGMVGIAWVTINRVNHPRWKNDICSVVTRAVTDKHGNPIRDKCQFAWYCDGKSDAPNLENKLEREAWELSGQIAYSMIESCLMKYNPSNCPPDPTHGAFFFRSGDIELTDNYYTKTTKVQDHTYYRLASK